MIIKHDFWYGVDASTRKLHIYLPDEYDYTEERYPVVYFFDGHNLFFDEDATFGKSWGLKEFLDHWDKPIIIVGLESTREGTKRLGEYSPYPGKIGIFSGFTPQGDATLQWIVNEVKPYIDQNYRTWWHREATAIAGSSMGGLMALYGLTKYNHIFSKGACVSSSISFCFAKLIKDIEASDIHPDTRAFLSWGEVEAQKLAEAYNLEDGSSATFKFNQACAEVLEKRGARTYLFCQSGGRHCEADWEKQIPFFMNFLWK